MAYGQIFFGDVMICAGEGKMFRKFIYQTILYIENQIFHFPQLARLSAQVTRVAH